MIPVTVTVQRKRAYDQSMAIFADWDDGDWDQLFQIRFAGEAGVDASGVSREFYSLYFTQCDLLEGGTLAYDGMASCDQYKTLGRVAAKAILSGHAGVGSFSHLAATYIVSEATPRGPMDTDIMDPEAKRAILEVSMSSELVNMTKGFAIGLYNKIP